MKTAHLLFILFTFCIYWRLTSDSAINSQWITGIEMAWRSHQVQFLAIGEVVPDPHPTDETQPVFLSRVAG